MIAKLSGFFESLEERGADMRVVVLVTSFGDFAKAATPERVRVTFRKCPLRPAEHISVTARLMPPPPEAVRPGGCDFARDAFFKGFGAVGSGLGVIERAPPPLLLQINAAIDSARNDMTKRIARIIGGQAGAEAAALVTGKRGLISEETNKILHGAGIYRIVSISGLHMVLAAGAIFWLARAILALMPGIALHWPLKKIAAVLAMAGATGYCIFSGSEVATERSLIMILVMLGTIVADRPTLSMRNLAISALIVMAMEPDSVLGPSFQMSLGAVAALIAFAEWQRRRAPQAGSQPGLLARTFRAVRLGLAGMLLTSLIAGAATGPFGAYHFQTFNPFGVLGNMMALPFVSLVVMPTAMVGAILYPLGLDGAAWWIMGLATEPALAASGFVAGLDGSTQVIPAYDVSAVLCLGAALILLTLLTTWLRFAAVLLLAAGVALAASPQRANTYIDREAAGVAARSRAGQLGIMGRPGNVVLEQWLRADGDSRKARDATVHSGAACDSKGCIVTLPDVATVAWSRNPETVK
ncbi:MAG: ComEC/Rec2 family competence protein [Hyphomicrobiales bacterium]|nr:ComEC/Rec2 family competence protein [Hyphomicrobiales bacterium]